MADLRNPEGREIGAIRLGTGETGVLLVHGYLATPEEMRGLAEFLAHRGLRVYVPLVAGHGTTLREGNTKSNSNETLNIKRNRIRIPMRRRWIRISCWSIVAGLLILALIPFAQFFYESYRTSPHVRSRSHAKNIACALNAYYRDNGEYPEFLVGGATRLKWGSAGSASVEAGPTGKIPEENPDPLLVNGYLRNYPEHPSHVGRMGTAKFKQHGYSELHGDPRGWKAIKNFVSAPNDPLVVGWRAQITWSWKLELEKKPKDRPLTAEEAEYFRQLAKYIEIAESLPRFLMAGGMDRLWVKEHEEIKQWPLRENMPYSPFPREVFELYPAYFISGYYSDYVVESFGYQRGDFMGSTSQEAKLWIYGDDRGLRGQDFLPKGLDLVNTLDGIPLPDGIPDGIILLYELKDGKTAKITWADDL